MTRMMRLQTQKRSMEDILKNALCGIATRNGNIRKCKKDNEAIRSYLNSPAKNVKLRKLIEKKLHTYYEGTILFFVEGSDIVLHIPSFNEIIVGIVEDFAKDPYSYPKFDEFSDLFPANSIFNDNTIALPEDEVCRLRLSPAKRKAYLRFSATIEDREVEGLLRRLLETLSRFCVGFAHYYPSKAKIQNYYHRYRLIKDESDLMAFKDTFLFARAKKITKKSIIDAIKKIPNFNASIENARILGFFGNRVTTRSLQEVFAQGHIYTFYPTLILFLRSGKKKVVATYGADRGIVTESITLSSENMMFVRKGLSYQIAKLEYFAIESFLQHGDSFKNYYGNAPFAIHTTKVKSALQYAKRFLDDWVLKNDIVIYWQGFDIVFGYAHQEYNPASENYIAGRTVGWTINKRFLDTNTHLNSYGKNIIVVNIKVHPYHPIDKSELHHVLLHELAHIIDYEINGESGHDKLFYAFLMTLAAKPTLYEKLLDKCQTISNLPHREFERRFDNIWQQFKQTMNIDRQYDADKMYDLIFDEMTESGYVKEEYIVRL